MLRLVVLVAFVGVVAAAPAEAGGRQEHTLAREARKHKKLGLMHHKRGQFDRAIEKLQIAYGLSQEAILLFHLGEAYNGGQQYPQALYYYKQYAEADPRGAAKRGVPAMIEALAALTGSTGEPGGAAEPAPASGGTAPSKTTARPPTEATSAGPTRAPPIPASDADLGAAERPELVAPPEPRPAAPGRGKRLIGTATALTGLGVAGAGVYFARVASARADAISRLFDDGAQWSDDADRLYDEGETARRRALILTGAGGALVVGGAVLYLLGRRDASVAEIEIAATSGGGAVRVTCAF